MYEETNPLFVTRGRSTIMFMILCIGIHIQLSVYNLFLNPILHKFEDLDFDFWTFDDHDHV